MNATGVLIAVIGVALTGTFAGQAITTLNGDLFSVALTGAILCGLMTTGFIYLLVKMWKY